MFTKYNDKVNLKRIFGIGLIISLIHASLPFYIRYYMGEPIVG
jgi:hypothetical protein